MPIYEYRCSQCGSRQSKLWRSIGAVNETTLTCAKCGSRKLTRLVSRVRMVRGTSGAASRADDMGAGDGPGMDGLDESLMREMEQVDENDPRALGRLMRKMAAASGEDLGPEFGEVVGRLEKGEDPERIEREMGDLFGADADGMGGPEGLNGMDGMGGIGQAEGDSSSAPAATKPRAGRARQKSAAKPKTQTRPAAAKSSGKRATKPAKK